MSNTPLTCDVLAKLKAGQPIPARALRCSADAPQMDGEQSGKTIKVSIKARSRDPINHWFFGPEVHDLSTVRLPNKIALDDSHGNEIGYARPTLTEYGLELSGVVIPNVDNPQHESNRIAYNLQNGIPQEASIDFTGDYDLSEIPAGLTATVNGKPVTGPAVVFQNWTLRAAAICKEGADPSTQTVAQLAAGDEVAPAPKSITQFSAKDSVAAPEKQVSVSDKPETLSAPPTEPEAANLTAETPVVAVEAQAEATPEVEAVETPLAVEAVASAPAVEAMTVVKPQPASPDRVAELEAQIAVLSARITAFAKPSVPPIPGVPMDVASANAPKTWSEALDRVVNENPQMTALSQVQLADKQWPGLRAATRAGYKPLRERFQNAAPTPQGIHRYGRANARSHPSS